MVPAGGREKQRSKSNQLPVPGRGRHAARRQNDYTPEKGKKQEEFAEKAGPLSGTKDPAKMKRAEREKLIRSLEKEMKDAAHRLEFEEAAQIRDAIMELRAADPSRK